MVITTAQFQVFIPCSRRVGDLRWWGSVTMVPAGNKAERHSSLNHTSKTIHHHHHHHHCHHHHYQMTELKNFLAVHDLF